MPTWFRLGDLDLATHLFRSEQMRLGRPLSDVTVDVTHAFGIEARLIPVTDDPVHTVVTARDQHGNAYDSAMQEWFVRDRCEPAVVAVRFDGAAEARPAPGVIEALEAADTIIICPSNPVISIGPLLAMPGIRPLLERRRDRVIGISPIVAGAPVKGPADRLMGPLGIPVSSVGVAEHYREFCATLVIDTVDKTLAPLVEAQDVRCVVTDTLMRDQAIAAALANTVLEAMH